MASPAAQPDLTAYTYIFGTVKVMGRRRRAIKQIVEPPGGKPYDKHFWFTIEGKAKYCTPAQIDTFKES